MNLMRIDLDNLEEWTKEYTKVFRDCFTFEYSVKWLKHFSENRFVMCLHHSDIELSEKQFKKYEKIFVKTFMDEMVRLIEEDRKNMPKKSEKNKGEK